MIWFWLVLGLAVVWAILWVRSRRNAHQLRLGDPRRLEALRLEDEAEEHVRQGRFAAGQAARLKALWLRTDPPAGNAEPPDVLDPRNAKHLMLADAVRQSYAQTMADRAGQYAECTVKPSALLPFPKEAIERSLTMFVNLGRGESQSPLVSRESITPEDVAVVERALQALRTYVDVDAASVPTDPAQNLEFAQEYLRSGH